MVVGLRRGVIVGGRMGDWVKPMRRDVDGIFPTVPIDAIA
jgi:hypothetical protein